ncbi:MAG: cysteine--tRNA ligase [Candidatus Omnitrophota bacterium]
MIALYNTLTRKKEDFRPLEENKVKMYVCGPTVYDVPHIGHARSAYIFEVIRRYLEYEGYDVFFVRNVTDVDDKIIKKASDELREISEGYSGSQLKERVTEVAVRYLDIYHREMDMLGIRLPVVEPKATEYIPQMIEFVETLIQKDHAYVVGGSVYFSVEKFKEYGKLSNQDKEQMMHGVRIGADENKQHPLDFALWKEAKEGEPFWQSPWGEGRPGWHIECSVMSMNLLGKEFDIHGGGLDLIFPHHENEVAQAEAATDERFARYWIHNGLLSVGGEKMSKSLGNYITISDFLDKYKDPDLLKIFFLMSHYRSPVDYNEGRIDEAGSSKERIMIFFDKIARIARENSGESVAPEAVEKAQRVANDLQEKFENAMNDDFNTPAALSVIFEAVHIGNDFLSDEKMPVGEKVHIAGAIKNFVLRFADTLGLSLRPTRVDEKEVTEIEELVTKREEARKGKDYAMADSLREELAKRGVVVEDTPEGPVWRKS